MKRVFSILVITAVIALGNLTAQANTAPLMTVNTTAIAAAVQDEAADDLQVGAGRPDSRDEARQGMAFPKAHPRRVDRYVDRAFQGRIRPAHSQQHGREPTVGTFR